MRAEVKRVMDEIDAVLAKGDAVAQDLWSILTALRGPDDYDSAARKEATTMRLRGAVLPKTRITMITNMWYPRGIVGSRRIPSMPYPDESIEVERTTIISALRDHFGIHFNEAVEAFKAVDDNPAATASTDDDVR